MSVGARALRIFGSVSGAALTLLLPMGLLSASPAMAWAEDGADDSTNVDALLVTGASYKAASSGTKTDTPLIETPQSITVIDNAELTRRNVQSINQAMGYVAGVSPNQRGGAVTRYDQMNLRGFTPSVYLDGMRLIAGPYSTPQIDFHRIDRLDVVKGPASVLYGNSSPGGLINLTSKLPQPEAGGRAEVGVGNFDTLRASLDLNQPLDAEGRVLFRVVGGGERSDGFVRGTQSERYYVSPMATVALTPRTSLTLVTAYQRDPKGAGYSGVPAYGSVLANPFGRLPRDINTGDPAYEKFDRKQTSIAAFLRHEFSDAIALESNWRHQATKLSYRQLYVAGFATTGTGAGRNTDFSTIVRGGGGADEDFETLTGDTHLNARFQTGTLRHNVLGGFDYQKITGENFQHFNTGVTSNPVTSIPNLNLFQPVYGGTMPSFALTQVNTYTEREQTGVYLQDQVAIGALQLIASGRYDWYDQTSLNKVNGVTTPLSQKAFTGRVGGLYAFDSGLAPFVSYSESFEPQAGSTYDGTPFDPVSGRQYEAGVKYQPPGTTALFTLTTYDLRRQKVPVGDPRAGTGGVPSSAQIQIGEVRVRGVEFEGRGKVARGLDLIVAATYADSEITQGAPASGVTPTTTGTRSLATPKWMASSLLTYDLEAAPRGGGLLGGLTVGGGLRYVAGSDGTTSYAVVNGASVFERFSTKDFVLVDALASYDLGRLSPRMKGFDLALNAANLLDKRHVSACPFNNSCYFGAGRTVMMTLRRDW